MKWGTVAVGTAVAVALSGCGGGGTSSTATTASTGKASAATALPQGTPATLRGVHGSVLRRGDLPGFDPGRLTLSTSAENWVAEAPPAQRGPEAASLKALGFVAGLTEQLAPAKGAAAEGGVSLVEQFRAARGASDEIATQLKQALRRGESAFTVAGIPGARGFGYSGASTDANVAFAVGPYYYLVGFGYAGGGGTGHPTRAQLIATAQSLYGRVRA
jgi:hypothetical protein